MNWWRTISSPKQLACFIRAGLDIFPSKKLWHLDPDRTPATLKSLELCVCAGVCVWDLSNLLSCSSVRLQLHQNHLSLREHLVHLHPHRWLHLCGLGICWQQQSDMCTQVCTCKCSCMCVFVCDLLSKSRKKFAALLSMSLLRTRIRFPICEAQQSYNMARPTDQSEEMVQQIASTSNWDVTPNLHWAPLFMWRVRLSSFYTKPVVAKLQLGG